MSISHVQFATLGTYPGCSTYNLATLGFGAIIEIIVVPPVVRRRGGGQLEVIDVLDSRREVIVTIRYKERSWSTSMLVDQITLNSIINVYVTFKNVIKRVVGIVINRIK